MVTGYVATYDNNDLIVSTTEKGMIDAFIGAGIFQKSEYERLKQQGLQATCDEAGFQFRTVNLDKGMGFYSGELYDFHENTGFEAESSVKRYGMLGAGAVAALALLSHLKK